MRDRRNSRRRDVALAIGLALLLLALLRQRSAASGRSAALPPATAASDASEPPAAAIDVEETERICNALCVANDPSDHDCIERCEGAAHPRSDAARPARATESATPRPSPLLGESEDLPEDSDLIEFGTDVDASRSYVVPMPTELPGTVDHTTMVSRIFDQGDAPVCSWLASLAALEESIQLEQRSRIRLSAMLHLAHAYPRSWTRMALSLQNGIVEESASDGLTFPWNPARVARWVQGLDLPDDAMLARLDRLGTYAAVALRTVYRSRDRSSLASENIARALASGMDVYASFRCSDVWREAADDNGLIPEYTLNCGRGHAVLIVGYRPGADGRQFVFRNSWSRGWGTRGYGFVSDRVVDRDVRLAFVLQGGRRAPLESCPGTGAALVDGRCHPSCPTGLLDEMCNKPPSTVCPEGYAIGRDGTCVRACRVFDVHQPGLDVHCAASGCWWAVEDGAYGCQARGGMQCTRFCPAPHCELMTNTTPDGATVVGCGGAWDADRP